MKRVCSFVVISIALTWLLNANAQAPLTAPHAFEAVQALVGNWEASIDNGKIIKVNYKLMSNNSILVETFTTPSGKETLSVYHLDGSHLLLTHYCGLGNQPRLRFCPKRSNPKKLVFDFYDATNLSSRQKEHMVHLEAALIDESHFEQMTIYRAGKEQETSTLRFLRVEKRA